MVSDYGILYSMEQIAVSKFKATCLAVLEKVRKTRQPVSVTRFGEPVAEIVPPRPAARPARWIGSLANTARIQGDIVSTAADERDWEVLNS